VNLLSAFYKEIEPTAGISYVQYFIFNVASLSIFFPISLAVIAISLFLAVYQLIDRKKSIWMHYLILGTLILSSILLKIGFESLYRQVTFYDGINNAYDYALIGAGVHLVIYGIYSFIQHQKNKIR
jgi:hypothetical protein